jgi:hypothetical protein
MNPEAEAKSDKKTDAEIQQLLVEIEELQRKVTDWKAKKQGDQKLETAERLLNLCKERAERKSPLSVQKRVSPSHDQLMHEAMLSRPSINNRSYNSFTTPEKRNPYIKCEFKIE